MKKVLVLLAVAAIIIAGIFLYLSRGEEGKKYRTEKAAKGDIAASVTATGTINSVTTVLVGTQVSGMIKDIYADFNSPVKKGQVIARIDPGVFQAQADQARANLLSARANLDRSKTLLKDAKRTLDRTAELFRRNLIARSELDAAETAHATADAQVSAALAQVAQTEAALKAAETNLVYTKILSPVNGIVISRNVDVGQTVAASFQTPTLFTIAEDLTKMQVNCSVAEADIGKIKKGLPVEFRVDAYPDEVFSGEVSEIRMAPVIVQNVVTYDVVIRVDNPELKLKPGMTANVSVIYAESKGALKVPNSSFRFKPEGFNSRLAGKNGKDFKKSLWILKGSQPEKIDVQTGISDGTFTEIITNEIKEGQEVITGTVSKPTSANSGPVGRRPF